MNAIRRHCSIVAMSLAVPFCAAQAAAPAQKTFASPEAAVAALRAAVEASDKASIHDIFGPGISDLLTGDEKLDQANSRKFAKALAEGAATVAEKDGTVTVEVGANKWPFPIPLVRNGSAWRFDTAAGKEEIVSRHIGKDELHAIGLCRAYAAGGALPKTGHGYIFRLLARDGGSSLTAYPEHWGRSGIMTFVVNPDGKLYQRDLGEKTAQRATIESEYAPGAGWVETADKGIPE